MVTRKPVPQSSSHDPTVPPPTQDASAPSRTENNAIWGIGDEQSPGQQDVSQVPAVLLPGDGHTVQAHGSHGASSTSQETPPVPEVLLPGGGSRPETNPFKRKMSLSTSGASQAQSPASTNIPPVPSIPVADFSQLSINDSSTNPWQPALGGDGKDVAGSVPRMEEQDSIAGNVWDSSVPSSQPTQKPGSNSPAFTSPPSEEASARWSEEAREQPSPRPLITTVDDEALDDAKVWGEAKPSDKEASQLPAISSNGPAGSDEWNLIDIEPEPVPLSRQSTWENFKDDEDSAAEETPAAAEARPQEPPELPPRNTAERPPAPAPRPVDKSETYQIKRINWYDASAANNPRTSPILVQNANGPCPLVALVNALVLTTPADRTDTALVGALKSREQVSLGLLLDAVFDELMFERRPDPEVPLPDVTELYKFLEGLHTGMNVNPRFIPTPEVVAALKRTSLTHLHPAQRTDMVPGTFEHTREMALYSTFSIPLIHGWLPSKDDAAYDAFSRQAGSYEDAQNLLFREEELEDKLCNSAQGLTPEEQQIYQDVLTIKSFLSISATQLTKFGLEVIKQAMKPGSIAILFRNDHFSTLYRHPETLELLTLVTDAGYAGHAEVVWESLVDVNGERAEFFSGDFRPVGGAQHGQPSSSSRDAVPDNWEDAVNSGNDGWNTVQTRRGSTSRHGAPAEETFTSKHEQEDRDLALALQLQEEEDERARAERRRRESLLSEQYIEQQGRGGGGSVGQQGGAGRGNASQGGGVGSGRHASYSSPSLVGGRRPTPAQPRLASASTSTQSVNGNISGTGNSNRPRPTTQTVRSLLPPRGSSTTATNTTTPLTHRPADQELEDAPPSYEQAAKQEPYIPPVGHPAHPGSTPAASSSTATAAGGMPQPQQEGIGPGGGRGSPGRYHQYPGVNGRGGGSQQPPGGYRRGVPPPANSPMPVSGGSGRERDCVVM
ncbi:hypothetical protein VTH82DRAFT_176 [Thermothelomyces myriococcoides]